MTRWRLLCLLLRRPDRVSRRLVRLLDRWPTETRRHECRDTHPLRKRRKEITE